MKKFDIKNWWYYHKWYVIAGIILIGIFVNILGNKLHLWTPAPDYQIAYIGPALPKETADALQGAFEELSEDLNGDGKIRVQLNQYIDQTSVSANDADAQQSAYAFEVRLIADIEQSDSYFFITDDPTDLQREYRIFANDDGSCPDEDDFDVENKVVALQDTALFDHIAGSYTEMILGQPLTGENADRLQALYIGRRCFYTDQTTAHADGCDKIWNKIRRK